MGEFALVSMKRKKSCTRQSKRHQYKYGCSSQLCPYRRGTTSAQGDVHLANTLGSEGGSVVPVILVEGVLDGHDGEVCCELGVQLLQLLTARHKVCTSQTLQTATHGLPAQGLLLLLLVLSMLGTSTWRVMRDRPS